MPSSTPERRARWWPEDDLNGTETATRFLLDRGYALLGSWCFRKPSPDHEVTEEEGDAIIYLIEEWDYGGIALPDDKSPVRREAQQ